MFTLSFSTDTFRLIYSGIALFMWLVTGVMSFEYFKGHHKVGRYVLFNLLTLASVLGVFLAGDLLTLFTFFEVMSFTSYAWVAQEESEEALRASKTYLAVAVIGGLVMLMGLFLLYYALGTLKITEIGPAAEAFLKEGQSYKNIANKERYLLTASILISFGFAAKAGIFPLHIWLPKAHPVAPAPASALLSGMLTKCGIFGMLLVSTQLMSLRCLLGGESGTVAQVYSDFSFYGNLCLFLGTVTMLLGALLGIFSVDLKRTLACSSVSQIGFITFGIGVMVLLEEEGTMALYATVSHMVNHSLFKLVLFCIAGIVYMKGHSLNLNDIRGLGRRHPVFGAAFALGGLGLAGVPGTGGFISKSLLHESLLEYIEKLKIEGSTGSLGYYKAIEVVFLISGGLTLAYMLKLFVAIFLEKDARHDKKGDLCSPVTAAFVCAPAVLILILGICPGKTFGLIGKAAAKMLMPNATAEVNFYTWITSGWLSGENLKGAAISACIGLFVYFVIVRKLLLVPVKKKHTEYIDVLPKWLDLENTVYRPVLLGFLTFVCAFVCRICDCMVDGIVNVLKKTVLSPRKHKMSIWVGTRLTHMVGSFLDKVVGLFNRTVFRRNPIKKSFVSILAVSETEAKQTFALIIGSVSFGLLLAALGLVITLMYILL